MNPRKVDIHTYILPPVIPNWKSRFGYGGFVQLDHAHAQCPPDHGGANGCRARMVRDDGKFFREVGANCWDPIERIRECDEQGVDVQVLSTVPVLFSYWAKPRDGLNIAQFLNDHIAEVVEKNPTRFVGLGTLPLQAPELAVRELERCSRDLGLAGVQIGSHVNDWNLDAKELFPVFETAERLGMSIFVHPWDMMGQAQMQKYWLPWLVGMPAEASLAICSMIFGGVFERLPKLRVAFAHGGGAFPGTLGRIEHGFQVRPDLCAVDNPHSPRSYLGRFWVDSLTHDARQLEMILELFGRDRVALGSDYPFPLGESPAGQLIESLASIDAPTRSRLLAKNALAWLGKEPS